MVKRKIEQATLEQEVETPTMKYDTELPKTEKSKVKAEEVIKVRMLKTWANPEGCFSEGRTLLLPANIAWDLINKKCAEKV